MSDELYDQYKFGCICIIVSGIIELLAETPVFVAQVFCFVKLRVVLDTLHIFVRSTLFIVLVIRDSNQAIFAFSIAQVGSTITFAIGYYAYFFYLIETTKKLSGAVKRAADNYNNEKTETKTEPDDSIPFNSIKQMLPGNLESSVISVNNKKTFRFREKKKRFFFFVHLYYICIFSYRAQYSMRIFKHWY